MQINNNTVKLLRTEKSWTQQHLADASGVSLRTIQRVESDGTASKETVMSLCAVFEISQSKLIDLADMLHNKENKEEKTVSYHLFLFTAILSLSVGGVIGAGLIYLIIR
ncbi:MULTISPECIES: helix-turn-helix transcriptional regulator [Pseudoalteromonas]|uniref:helix-turn-helix transcriptional regulator n=1 Tax=Pseudoalteromonas TaxID=53246 RepID=UPI00029A5BEB|nr:MULTISPECIES: helix-turn-helix transcriptional regulator [Pseudoalteromonas]AUJ71592.1 hypothetical protein PNC201_16875 [Pseudoalteromonas sp. NC201]MBR8841902.1 helix-turn-helix transcriptional regulator [Pseudoalteromonas sp. JC3]MCG7554693.1 helix-turn-helix domain-containing protein [Pseudoalteromonas sp. Of11M-6]NSY34970.1 XRE family transcriptional regulator [Pseudoalteromonas sp. JC28]QUI72466.1 helix-turn-helix domain-containing protein [Pseudoalteromonas sp. M8]